MCRLNLKVLTLALVLGLAAASSRPAALACPHNCRPVRAVTACPVSPCAPQFVTSGPVMDSIPAPQFTTPRAAEVELFLRNVWSDNTTELGADEVYILLLATSSDGRQVARRLPSSAAHTSAGHWDMNDNKSLGCNRGSGDSHCIEDKFLGAFDTNGNTSWDVTVAFMEEDRGLEKAPEQILREAVEQGRGSRIGTLLAILVGFANNDSDDFIGSVVAHIQRGRVSWRAGERIRQSVPYPADASRLFGFQMIGDGANYTGHIGLR
jgi:hypothetical protein